MKNFSRLFATSLLACTASAFAASFNITTTVNSGQTLTSGETGTVSSTGKISVSGSTVGVTFSGSGGTRTLTNSGTIEQTGSGRALRSTTSGITINVTNNATGIIQSQSDDTFQINAANVTVVLDNYGIIRNNGTDSGQAIDWANMTTGSNTLHNHSGGQILTTGADAVRLGVNGVLTNAGTIRATPYQETPGVASGSDGVDLQNNTGSQITNSGSGLISGRHGITGGDDTHSVTVSVTNGIGATIEGSNGSGINIDHQSSVATVINNGTIVGKYNPVFTDGDGDGVDVDGSVDITNNGVIRGTGAAGINPNDFGANNAEGISIGGGVIVNNVGAEITGQNVNGTAGRLGNGILVDNSNNGAAYAATTITNSGTIRGYTGFGIKMVGDWNDTITNEATGTIRGGTVDATIQTGDGSDTLTNRGTITSDTGFAIDLGAGNDTLKVEGSASTITGSVTGGTGTNTLIIDAGATNTFAHSSTISNFSVVEIHSGSASLSGANTFEATISVADDARLNLIGSNRIDSDSLLELDGGTLSFESIGAANGQRFASLALGMDSLIDLNNTTTLTFGALGTVVTDASLSIVGHDTGLAGYAIRFEGDLTGNAAFQLFLADVTINGEAAEATFSGGYTELAPVPEPSTFALIGLGLAMAIWWRSRKAAVRVA